MSYSFNARAANKAALKEEIKKALLDVVSAQPIHKLDASHAEKIAHDTVDLMAEPDEDNDMIASCNGSTWTQNDVMKSLSVGVNVYYVLKGV